MYCRQQFGEVLSSSRWMKEEEGREEEKDDEGLRGITDPDYVHFISLLERESVGPNRPIQPPLAGGKDADTFLPETLNM